MACILAVSAAACGRRSNSDSSAEANTAAESSSDNGENKPKVRALEEKTEDYGTSAENANRSYLVVYFTRPANTDFTLLDENDEDVDYTSTASINIESDGSYTGNAQLLARYALRATGGVFFQVLTATLYSPEYEKVQDDALKEQQEGTLPYLANYYVTVSSYNTIILVSPIWWGTLPQPVFTFLYSNDFSGKTIIPILTGDGSSSDMAVKDIKSICTNADVKNGIVIDAQEVPNSETEVADYLANYMK